MWPDPQKAADLVTFTEEIFNGKLHFLRSVKSILETIYVIAQLQRSVSDPATIISYFIRHSFKPIRLHFLKMIISVTGKIWNPPIIFTRLSYIFSLQIIWESL